MPTNTSIFADEWRDCLRAHYTYVVRMDDRLTEKSLRGVMIEAGFSDAELSELKVRATMHVDDVGADFVPDMDVLSAEPSASAEVFSVPAVAMPPEVIEIETVIAEEALMLNEATLEESTILDEVTTEALAAEIDETEADERELEEDVTQDDEPPPPAADPDVTQLSLF